MDYQIILASQSPRRRELLSQIGLDFIIIPAQGEEHSDAGLLSDYVMDLAAGKAGEIAGLVAGWKGNHSSSIDLLQAERVQPLTAKFESGEWSLDKPILVIGSDTIVARGQDILGKPVDEADACHMLHQLQGATHQVYTGVGFVLLAYGQDGWKITRDKHFYEQTDVTFGPVSEEEIRQYVASGDPMDKAGSYGIQGEAGKFISGIKGDYNNVVGLPVARLYQELKMWTEAGDGVDKLAVVKDKSSVSQEILDVFHNTENVPEDKLTRLNQQFNFLRELDQEKMIGRQTYLTGGVRKENDAEHAWHMAVMSLCLQEYANEDIDLLKTISMILIHDVVEIDAGDTYAYDVAGKATQAEREKAAADRIFGMLPKDQAVRFRALFEEFEARETAEAKFARTMDNVQPLMLNRANMGRSWMEHSVHLSQVLGRNARSHEGSEVLWQYAYENFIKPSMDEGKLIKDID